MINSKYVTVETILEKVKKDLPPVIDINIDDVVEFIWEALAKIGGVPAYITLYSVLTVDSYRTKLPSWLHLLKEVRLLTTNTYTNITPEVLQNMNAHSYRMAQITDTFDLSVGLNNLGEPNGHRYLVKDNYIHTTFEKGTIEIAYDAMPIDEQGQPLIPDNVYFIEAIKWYIIKSYMWRLMVRDTTYQTIFTYAESQWNFYVNSAASAAKIPDRDGLQGLMDKFLRIVPNLHRNIKYTYYRYPDMSRSEMNNFISPTYNGN